MEVVQPLASVKPVRAETLSTLLAPSLSRTTVPVLIVCRAERSTVPPARASNWVCGLVVVGGLGDAGQVGQGEGAAGAGGLQRGGAAVAGVAGDPREAQRRPAADR